MPIDSIRLKIPQEKYRITDNSYFCEIKENYNKSRANGRITKRMNNKHRKELEKGGNYIPRYTLEEIDFGYVRECLVVECSLPKLTNGHNWYDLDEKELPIIKRKLAEFLPSIGVELTPDAIDCASVNMVAFCKNIPVDQFGTVSMVLQILAPFNYRPRSEFTSQIEGRSQYRQLKYFNDNVHTTLYDKKEELKIDRKKTTQEEDLLEKIKNIKIKPSEILRIEYTLHGKHAVKQTLSKYLPEKKDYTLDDVFSNQLRDSVLADELNIIFTHNLREVITLSGLDRHIREKIIKEYSRQFTMRAKLQYCVDILNSRGLEELRKQVLEEASPSTWNRRKRDLAKMDKRIKNYPEIENTTNRQVIDYIMSYFIEASESKNIQTTLPI